MYLASLAVAAKDGTKPDDHRQLAGIFIKNALDTEVGLDMVLRTTLQPCTPSCLSASCSPERNRTHAPVEALE